MKLAINCMKCSVDARISGEIKLDKVHKEAINAEGVYKLNS